MKINMLNDFNRNSGNSAGTNGAGGNNCPTAGANPYLGPYPDADDFNPDEYLINYNVKFKNEAPTLFRDDVIQQTLSCLIGKFKPNALLVGAAGVGKTKIVEDIARRLENNDMLIPDSLKDHTIYELPLSNIVAGSKFVGDLEQKTKDIINFATNPKNKVILFIDEIHMVVGDSQTYDKIAQLLKPALARNDMKVIGATTLQESNNLKQDPAFNRRFTRLIVDELTKDQTETILHDMSTAMYTHYEKRIALTPAVISDVIAVSDEFKSISSHRPDNAITLLDRAMADAFIQRKAMEEEAKRNNNVNLIAALQANPMIVLSKSHIRATAMKIMTGNSKKDIADMDKLRDSLTVLKGQDDVINIIMDKIKRDQLSLFPRKKPLTLLLAGNSGVGKSELAKIIANELTGSAPIILNMTEYHSSASINRIIGAPAGYVGSDSKRELPFDILESNPYKIILLDELEKADKSVQRLFMSAFDEGFIKTSNGNIVDFSKTIIFATTNAGHTTKSGDSIGFTAKTCTAASTSELAAFFDTEFLNRFTKILNFNPITEDIFNEILADTYRRKVAHIKSVHPTYTYLDNVLDDATVKELGKKHYDKLFGARHVNNIIEEYIEDTVFNKMNAMPSQSDELIPDNSYDDETE